MTYKITAHTSKGNLTVEVEEESKLRQCRKFSNNT